MPGKNTRDKYISLSLMALIVLCAWLFGHKAGPWVAAQPGAGKAWRPVCGAARCGLCVRKCFLPEGTLGICNQRLNADGKISTVDLTEESEQ